MLDFSKFSTLELIEINQRVVEELKKRDQKDNSQELKKFKIGDRVSFQSKQGRISGIVTRVNQKTLTLVDEKQQMWRVSPQLVEGVAGQKKEKGKAPKNVIPMFK